MNHRGGTNLFLPIAIVDRHAVLRVVVVNFIPQCGLWTCLHSVRIEAAQGELLLPFRITAELLVVSIRGYALVVDLNIIDLSVGSYRPGCPSLIRIGKDQVVSQTVLFLHTD